MQDCANITLAIGASPVMANAPEEAAEITVHAKALVLNLGTLQASALLACANRLPPDCLTNVLLILFAAIWRKSPL